MSLSGCQTVTLSQKVGGATMRDLSQVTRFWWKRTNNCDRGLRWSRTAAKERKRMLKG